VRAGLQKHAHRAIDSCDLNTGVGLRDRAVLLLLARLGLRAHEIIALQLSDLAWDRGHRHCGGERGGQLASKLPIGARTSAERSRRT
jgi:integrase/recombinase XerD